MDSLQSSLICRLCGTESNDSTINIFDKTQEYVHQIHSVFPIFIHECEPFPKKMCHKCCERLKDTYEFHSTVLDTDSAFKSKLSWMPKRKQTLKNLGVPMVAIQNFNIKAESPIEHESDLEKLQRRNEENQKSNCSNDEFTDTQKNKQTLEVNNNDEKKTESSITIESVRKNLFQSPNIKKKTTRLRDIENALNDSKIQSTSALEFSESNLEDEIKSSGTKKKNSPLQTLSSARSLFVHRTSLRRPRSAPPKFRQKKLLKNQNDIAGLIESDSKLKFHVEVIVDKLPDRIVENISGAKKLLMEIKQEIGVKKEKKNLPNAPKLEMGKKRSRVSKDGRIQKLNETKNIMKSKRKPDMKISDKLMGIKISRSKKKKRGPKFPKRKKNQCGICNLKFNNRETYALHPCYCETR